MPARGQPPSQTAQSRTSCVSSPGERQGRGWRDGGGGGQREGTKDQAGRVKDSFLRNSHRTGRVGGTKLGIKCPVWLWIQGQELVTGPPGRPVQAVPPEGAQPRGPRLRGGGLPRGRDTFSSNSLTDDFCSFSLPTRSSLTTQDGLAPLSNSHKGAFVRALSSASSQASAH